MSRHVRFHKPANKPTEDVKPEPVKKTKKKKPAPKINKKPVVQKKK